VLVLPQAQRPNVLGPKGAGGSDRSNAEHVQLYTFGLMTSQQIVCRRCGVYVAMLLSEGDSVWSVINLDTLDDRALFTQAAEPRDWSAEDRATRIARRKARWTPTNLISWPASASG